MNKWRRGFADTCTMDRCGYSRAAKPAAEYFCTLRLRTLPTQNEPKHLRATRDGPFLSATHSPTPGPRFLRTVRRVWIHSLWFPDRLHSEVRALCCPYLASVHGCRNGILVFSVVTPCSLVGQQHSATELTLSRRDALRHLFGRFSDRI
jgi:hypothetical protein